MKIQQSKQEVQRAVRCIQDAFDSIKEGNPGKKYSVLIAIATPVIENKTDSEVSSLIDVTNRMIGQLSSDTQVSLQFDIVEYSDIANQLVEKAKVNYEASQKIQGNSVEKVD